MSYVTDRKQRVVLEGSHSPWAPVASGVPQGCILGPLLFTLYIKDIPQSVSVSAVGLYADDTKCCRTIASINDCVEMQNDIAALERRGN